MSPEVRFFACADSRFFPGVVGMLNSLRLSGNTHPAFVVDLGLTPDQRKRLSGSAEVLSLPQELRGMHPMFSKTTADVFWSDGVVVLLDSDMVVTGPLDDLVEQAAHGKIAVHPDHEINTQRRFSEWETTFALRGSVRPQIYVNASPLALSLDRWPELLGRWRGACRQLPASWTNGGLDHPYGAGDQDVLNAILMSEVPADALWVGSQGRTIHADALTEVRVEDERTLACSYRGGSPLLLHYGLSPKAWERRAWSRVRPDDAYIRLLTRVLFGRDAEVAAKRSEVPLWLWPQGVGRAASVVIRGLFLAGVLDGIRRSRDFAKRLVPRRT